jgi:hypothetical protein
MLDPALDRVRSEADVPVADSDCGQVAASHERVHQRPRHAQGSRDVSGGQQSLDRGGLVGIRRVQARDHAH